MVDSWILSQRREHCYPPQMKYNLQKARLLCLHPRLKNIRLQTQREVRKLVLIKHLLYSRYHQATLLTFSHLI